MNSSNKTSLFEDFLADWGKEFESVKHILNYIHSYPEIKSICKDLEFINPHDLEDAQKDWLNVVTEFVNPADKEFFKSCWVPVSTEGMGHFIDLSSKNFSLFETHYFSIEPYAWFKQFLIKDIRNLLLAPDDSTIDIANLLAENREEYEKTLEYIFESGRKEINQATEEFVILKNVMPTIIAIFPWTTAIQITDLQSKNPSLLFEDVNDIQAFLTVMQNTGSENITYFYLNFKDTENSYMEFKEGSLTIRHPDKALLKKLAEYGS